MKAAEDGFEREIGFTKFWMLMQTLFKKDNDRNSFFLSNMFLVDSFLKEDSDLKKVNKDDKPFKKSCLSCLFLKSVVHHIEI